MRYTFARPLLLLAALLAAPWSLAAPASGDSPTPVLTQHNDNGRTGAYLDETLLNASSVNSAQFGKLFTRAVDGQIYAQPLYVPSVALTGGPRNVVYVATMHDSVYAFDADDPAAAAPLWQVSLGTAAPITYTIPNTTTVGHDFGPDNFHDISPEVGILSTPVIDLASNTLYAVAFTREPSPATCPCQYAYRLHALSLTTGVEKFGGPVVISGTVPGNAADGTGSLVPFHPSQHNQRPGLLLQDGVIYFAFASFADETPYHGWLFGYDAATLAQVSVWNSTPNSGLGGIWQSGQGLAADEAGNIYTLVGNGGFNTATDNYGDSIVKLDPQGVVSGVLPVAGSFTPYNQAYLNAHDLDMGSFGPVLITGTKLLLGGGKTADMFVLNEDDMGGYQEGPDGTDRVVETVPLTRTRASPLFGAPIVWNGTSGMQLYVWTAGQAIQQYTVTIHSAISVTIPITPSAIGSTQLVPNTRGAYLSLSANGSTAGSGIVWALHTLPGQPTGVLHAYAADNVSQELWNSTQNTPRDSVGNLAKFNPPTIANGRVYVGTFSNQLDVYGIMAAPWVITQPLSRSVLLGHTAALTVTVSGQSNLSYQWYQGSSGDTTQPVGANVDTFTTPPLFGPASYWVRASNGLGHIDSSTAVFTLTVASSVLLPVIHR